MKLDKLPIEVLEWLKNLEYGSTTHQLDIQDAFDKADSLDEAVSLSTFRMEQLIAEAKENIAWLKGYQELNKEPKEE